MKIILLQNVSDTMIQLYTDEESNIVYTSWVLKLNKDTRQRKNKSGEIKTYNSYFTSFPQELYDFFNINDETLYLVKDYNIKSDVIITDTEPTLPVNYVPVKLITRRKNQNRKNRIPTTSFILSKKIFKNLETCNKVRFTLYPNSNERYRNKLGKITIEII